MTRFTVDQTVRATASVQGMRKGELYRVVQVDTRSVLGNTYATYHLVGDPMDGTLQVGNGHLLLAEVRDELPVAYKGMTDGKRLYWVTEKENVIHQVMEVEPEESTYQCSCTDGPTCDHILSILRERSEFEQADGDATP